jgi:hypothetical protein
MVKKSTGEILSNSLAGGAAVQQLSPDVLRNGSLERNILSGVSPWIAFKVRVDDSLRDHGRKG